MNRSKNIGTAAETAVVRYLRDSGFPHAERRALAGAYDLGDILTPGICWEVKGGNAAQTASDGQVTAWLAETETERRNAHADIGVLVMKRTAIGPANAGRWWAVLTVADLGHLLSFRNDEATAEPVRLHLSTVVLLLRAAGYGTPLHADLKDTA